MNATQISGETAPNARAFAVLLYRRSSVDAALVALAKRAARKGLTPIGWAWGKATTTIEHLSRDFACARPACRHCVRVDRIALTLTGDAPKFAGWAFAAALQHLDGENIVRALPGEVLPAIYRTRGPVCDHCKADRRRNDTYVLRHDDGRLIQVGSTCLGDFLGSDDAGALASAATMLAEACGACDDSAEGLGSSSTERTLAEYLPIVAFCVRSQGWTSRTVAREKSDGTIATADYAWRYLTDQKAAREDKVEPTPDDSTIAASAIAWADALTDAEIDTEKGDYLHNLRAVARTNLVSHRLAGIAASMITAYQRAMGRERERAERAARPVSDTHVGTVGKRETWAVTLDFVTGYDTDYGYTTVLKFRTAEGATIVWKASNTEIARGDVGKHYTLTGTVKTHGDYKGAKQTMVSRCKVVEEASK